MKFSRPKPKVLLKYTLIFLPLLGVVVLHLICSIGETVAQPEFHYGSNPRYLVYEREGRIYRRAEPLNGRPELLISLPLWSQDLLGPMLFVYATAVVIRLALEGMRLSLTKEEKWLKRYRESHCPQCDYDVRATRERCPECGSELAAAAGEMRRRVKTKAKDFMDIRGLRKELRREEVK